METLINARDKFPRYCDHGFVVLDPYVRCYYCDINNRRYSILRDILIGVSAGIVGGLALIWLILSRY